MHSTLRKSADPVAAKADLLVVCVADPPKPLDGSGGRGGLRPRRSGGARGQGQGDRRQGRLGDALPRRPPGSRPRGSWWSGSGAAARDDWRSAGRAAAGTASQAKAQVGRRGPAGLGDPSPTSPPSSRASASGAYRFDRFKTAGDATGRAGAPGGPLPRRPRRPTCAAPTASSRRSTGRATSPTRRATTSPRRCSPSARRSWPTGIPGLTCTVLGRARLEKLGAGALLGGGPGLATSRPA